MELPHIQHWNSFGRNLFMFHYNILKGDKNILS